MFPEAPTRDELRAANCWFSVDRVARDDATTAWKRRARYRQALWRGNRPMGFQPYAGTNDTKCANGLSKPVPMGSRLELDFAKISGANMLTRAAYDAALARVASPEPHQMLTTDRLWADLLSSMPLCFNLLGDLAAVRSGASRAVRAWFPDAPEGRVRVRFEHFARASGLAVPGEPDRVRRGVLHRGERVNRDHRSRNEVPRACGA
jgi:hypothetical protein